MAKKLTKERIKSIVERIVKLIFKDMWFSETTGVIHILKIVYIAVRGFIKDGLAVRASALTFYTLLSIVPVLALGFAIAKGFGLDERLSEFIRSSLSNQKEVADYLMQFSTGMLENAKGGLIAGIGIIMLLYSVFKLLNNIEEAFNFMWHIKDSRSMLRKVTDYVSIMIFAPILLLISISANVFITTMLQNVLTGYLTPILKLVIKLIPFFVLWIVFTLVYLIMPNTKVNFFPALVSGVITGTVFELVQWGYFSLQVGASKAGAIYGSFAALPLFLTWMQIAWTIVLVGCEICYSIQNVNKYSMDNEQISHKTEKLLSMLVMMHITKEFAAEKKLDDRAWADKLEISTKMFNRICARLCDVGLLAELKEGESETRFFIPAMDINQITANVVCSRIENFVPVNQNPYANNIAFKIKEFFKINDFERIENFKIPKSKELQRVVKEWDEIEKHGTDNFGNMLLKDL